MHLVASATPNQLRYHPMFEGIGYLELHYEELKCLEIAVYFLTQQLHHSRPTILFSDLRNYHVRYLNHWLSNTHLRQSLRLDSKNSVLWPVVSSEDAQWLLLALEEGIDEDTIIAMAADDANFERDMAMNDAESDDDFTQADLAFYDSYRSFYDYYCRILHHANTLIDKLKAVLNE